MSYKNKIQATGTTKITSIRVVRNTNQSIRVSQNLNQASESHKS